MNIFCLDNDPTIAAEMMCDEHIKSKMIVESAQMIANCFSLDMLKKAPLTKKGEFRKYSYEKHPCSIWTRQSDENLKWLVTHACAMFIEKICRGYINPHFSMDFIRWAADNMHKADVPKTGILTDFAIAININRECRKNPLFENLNTIEKYKLFYIEDKPFTTYRTNPPEFMKEFMKFNPNKNRWEKITK